MRYFKKLKPQNRDQMTNTVIKNENVDNSPLVNQQVVDLIKEINDLKNMVREVSKHQQQLGADVEDVEKNMESYQDHVQSQDQRDPMDQRSQDTDQAAPGGGQVISEAVDFIIHQRDQDLQILGIDDPKLRENIIHAEIIGFVDYAHRRGLNIHDHMTQLAHHKGMSVAGKDVQTEKRTPTQSFRDAEDHDAQDHVTQHLPATINQNPSVPISIGELSAVPVISQTMPDFFSGVRSHQVSDESIDQDWDRLIGKQKMS